MDFGAALGLNISVDLTDAVVVITGAAAGIGEATARQLLDEGALVALIDRDEAALKLVAASLNGRAASFVADVTDEAAVNAAIAGVIGRFGGIDVFGVARTIRAALPSIIERNGYVLVVASGAALIPTPTISAYGASKAAAEALGRSLRMELTETGATAASRISV